MKLGIGTSVPDVACRRKASSGTPAWLEEFRAPGGNLPPFVADFVAGNYWAGDAEQTLNAILVSTDEFEGNPASTDADGLVLPPPPLEEFPYALKFTGAAFTDLNQDGTWVIELLWEPLESNQVLIYRAGANGSLQTLEVQPENDPDQRLVANMNTNASGNRFLLITETGTPATDPDVFHRVAITFSAAKTAASVDGGVVVSSTAAAPLVIDPADIDTFRFGGGVGGYTGRVRSVAFYPTQPDADLPTL